MNTPTKVCGVCHQELPATSEYFHYRSKTAGTFKWACKTCRAIEKREYRATHQEQIKAQGKEYRERTADKQKMRHDEYHAAHPEVSKRAQKRYYDRHAEARRENTRKWRQANPEKRRELEHRRRNARLNSEGFHTAQDIRRQYKSQKGKCYWCGKRVGQNYHVDHVIPLNRGGSDNPDNLVIACPRCNLSKSYKLPHEWDGNNGKMF